MLILNHDFHMNRVISLWDYFKKFLIFAGVFAAASIILSLITGLILTYFYSEEGFSGHPLISTMINCIAAAIAILAAYKPFKKKGKPANNV
jgi:hypothetical protein